MFVCMCLAVTEAEIRGCISDGARTVEDVAELSLACTGCGGCRETIREMLAANELAHSVARLCALPQRA
jgi:bacterioferritin-associated ferredoxin